MRPFLPLILVALSLLSISCLTEEKQVTAAINGAEIKVEIVKTPDERAKGLMYRDRLGENEGMLFIFEAEGYHAFWMKNVNFPLGILWLDKELRVIHISANTLPCTTDPCEIYSPSKPAKYVLEVNANFTIENNVKVGDKVFIRGNFI